MNIPKVSVIVPVYNVENYLPCCMDSLLNQTLKDIQIILVDDGSPDHCPSMCDEYAKQDHRVKVIHKKNEGLGYARNSGLEIAAGAYIAFVDSDDYVELNAYQKIYALATDTEADVVYYTFQRFNDQGDVWGGKSSCKAMQYFTKEEIRMFMLNMISNPPKAKNYIEPSVWSGLYCNEVIKRHKLRFKSERELISEDRLFNIDFLLHSSKVITIPDVFYNYRLNLSSLSRMFRTDRISKYHLYYQYLLKILVSNNFGIEGYLRATKWFVEHVRNDIHRYIQSPLSKKKKIQWLKEVSNHHIWREIASSYPYKKMPRKHALQFYLLQKGYCHLLYYLEVINNFVFPTFEIKILKKMENKNINVMHLVSSFKKGGLEILLLSFLKVSSENVTVVIMNNQVDENLRQELLKTGCKIFCLGRTKGHKHPKYLFRLLKIIKENNIDIIHSHNPGGMMWSILCKILKPKLKNVYTIHSSTIVKNWNIITLFINKIFIDKNIAISEDILNDCVINNLKVTKIYNGIDTEKFKSAQSDVYSFNIINVARITHQIKGQDILIKALKKCKDKAMKFTCKFVGGVYKYDTNSFENLKQLIEDLDLSEEIKFLGNREDVPELLVQSNLFILPSRLEGLPLSLLEAMASKLPVIASNISGSSEIIDHNKNGLLFESEDHSDLAEKILFLYNHREEMKRLAINGYEFAQRFDISVMFEKYWKLYYSLMKK